MTTYLEKYGIKSLWYITHIDNLESILEEGILSRYIVERKRKQFVDISDTRVQVWRESWHRYVPLFFAHNTPMLYKVVEKYGKSIILLEIDPNVMYKKGVWFTDGNVASKNTTIYNKLRDLKNLDWKIINSSYGAYSYEWKLRRSAEVLVPNKVEKQFIKAIHLNKLVEEDYLNNIFTLVVNCSVQYLKGEILEFNCKIRIICDLTQEGIKRYG